MVGPWPSPESGGATWRYQGFLEGLFNNPAFKDAYPWDRKQLRRGGRGGIWNGMGCVCLQGSTSFIREVQKRLVVEGDPEVDDLNDNTFWDSVVLIWAFDCDSKTSSLPPKNP